MKTRAAILVEQHKPLVIDEVELPDLTFGQVRVRVGVSGICASQLGEIDGVKGPDPWLPHLLGHEACGMVEEVGPYVTTVSPGDRVVLHWRPGAGIEAPVPAYRWGARSVNAGRVTTFQDQTIVSENRVTRIPASVDPESAVLYGCALTTGYGVVCNDARVCVGESIVVLGCGGVGMCVILAARLAGAHPIVAVDVQEHKLAIAKRQGATTLCQAGDDLDARVREAVGNQGVDVVVETTGHREIIETAYRLTGPAGRTILVGVPGYAASAEIDTLPLHFGKVLTGSHGGRARPDRDIPRLLRMQRAGRFSLDDLVSHRFPLSAVNEAIDQMRGGVPVRCVLEMGSAEMAGATTKRGEGQGTKKRPPDSR